MKFKGIIHEYRGWTGLDSPRRSPQDFFGPPRSQFFLGKLCINNEFIPHTKRPKYPPAPNFLCLPPPPKLCKSVYYKLNDFLPLFPPMGFFRPPPLPRNVVGNCVTDFTPHHHNRPYAHVWVQYQNQRDAIQMGFWVLTANWCGKIQGYFRFPDILSSILSHWTQDNHWCCVHRIIIHR
jgi:hypothetical protein